MSVLLLYCVAITLTHDQTAFAASINFTHQYIILTLLPLLQPASDPRDSLLFRVFPFLLGDSSGASLELRSLLNFLPRFLGERGDLGDLDILGVVIGDRCAAFTGELDWLLPFLSEEASTMISLGLVCMFLFSVSMLAGTTRSPPPSGKLSLRFELSWNRLEWFPWAGCTSTGGASHVVTLPSECAWLDRLHVESLQSPLHPKHTSFKFLTSWGAGVCVLVYSAASWQWITSEQSTLISRTAVAGPRKRKLLGVTLFPSLWFTAAALLWSSSCRACFVGLRICSSCFVGLRICSSCFVGLLGTCSEVDARGLELWLLLRRCRILRRLRLVGDGDWSFWWTSRNTGNSIPLVGGVSGLCDDKNGVNIKRQKTGVAMAKYVWQHALVG